MIRDRFVSFWHKTDQYRAAAARILLAQYSLTGLRPQGAELGTGGYGFSERPYPERPRDVARAGFGRESSFAAVSASDARVSATIASWLLPMILLVSVALQIYLGMNTDTSWNITLAEKVLDGLRPNIDFIEINPPMSYFIYLAPALAARLTGLSAEFMVDLFCFVGAAASLYLAGVILVRSRVIDQPTRARLIFFAAVALLLLPARAFSEREHIALIAAMPCIAALIVCASRAQTEPLLGLFAGLGAGLAISIKPHFALFFLLGFLYAARRSGWRASLRHPSLYAALAFVVLYWSAVAAFLPAFFERVAPIVSEIYLPARKGFSALLFDPSFTILSALAAALTLAAHKRIAEPSVAIPALATFGAIVAYLVQGKFWPYQAYPAFAFMMLAIGPLVVDWVASPAKTSRSYVGLAAAEAVAGLFALAGLWLGQGWDQRALEKAVSEVSARPTMLAISPDIATGYPLTRRVHGVWVGSSFGLWMTSLSMNARARNPDDVAAGRRYEAYMRLDRERLVADILGKKPEVILVPDEQWLGWALSQEDVKAALSHYDLRADVDRTSVFVRRGEVAATGSARQARAEFP